MCGQNIIFLPINNRKGWDKELSAFFIEPPSIYCINPSDIIFGGLQKSLESSDFIVVTAFRLSAGVLMQTGYYETSGR